MLGWGSGGAQAPLLLLGLCGCADFLELDPSGRGAAPQEVGCAALWGQKGLSLCVLPRTSSQSPGHGKS